MNTRRNTICSICHEVPITKCLISSCFHVFCAFCLARWLVMKRKCAYCKGNIDAIIVNGKVLVGLKTHPSKQISKRDQYESEEGIQTRSRRRDQNLVPRNNVFGNNNESLEQWPQQQQSNRQLLRLVIHQLMTMPPNGFLKPTQSETIIYRKYPLSSAAIYDFR